MTSNDLVWAAKWPNVPACYGWLSLDQRGDWRLQGERVTHRGLIAFMNRQYSSDESGRWFVQNGPQRVYVDLAATPWVFRRDGEALLAHTGQPAGELRHIYLDEAGRFLLATSLGLGLLDDRDLPGVIDECRDDTGQAASPAQWMSLFEGQDVRIFWRGLRIEPFAAVDRDQYGNFVAQPRAAPDEG